MVFNNYPHQLSIGTIHYCFFFFSLSLCWWRATLLLSGFAFQKKKIKKLGVNRLWTTEWGKQGFIRIIDAGESCQKTVAKIAVPNPSSGWWSGQDLTWRLCRSTQLTRGFIRSQLPVVNHCLRTASHHRLLNLTFKKVVVVISSTETGRNNYESLYFIL